MDRWLMVPIVIVGGLILGLLLSRLVHSLAASPRRPAAIQQVARPLSSLALSIGLVIGLIAALAIVAPTTLEQLPRDVVAYVPRVLTAALIVIVARVLASFALTALAQTLGRAPLQLQRQAATAVKLLIYTMATLLAVSQLGVDTKVVNMGLAAVFFGVAASLTLLIGLGGHGVAREVASTRALKRLIDEGDSVTVGEVSGLVVAVHPTAVEVAGADGGTVLVPSSSFLRDNVGIVRAESDTPSAPDGSI